MKYIACPQCGNKIIERTPLKCVYCGYDSTNVKEEKLKPIGLPQRPNRQSYTNAQTISLLISVAAAIAFLITFFLTKATVVDGVLVETEKDMSTARLILGIITVISFSLFISSNRNYESEIMKYQTDILRIAEINKRIEAGATLQDFDEIDRAMIINAQEDDASQSSNQKVTGKYFNFGK